MSKYTTIEIVGPTTGSVTSLERSAVGDIAIDPYNDAWVKQSDQKWHFEDDGDEETATGMVERYNRLIIVHLPTKEVTNTVNVVVNANIDEEAIRTRVQSIIATAAKDSYLKLAQSI